MTFRVDFDVVRMERIDDRVHHLPGCVLTELSVVHLHVKIEMNAEETVCSAQSRRPVFVREDTAHKTGPDENRHPRQFEMVLQRFHLGHVLHLAPTFCFASQRGHFLLPGPNAQGAWAIAQPK